MTSATTLGGTTAGGADITLQHYSGLSGAFRFLNERLFGGQLPQPLFTLQRKNRMRGYYHEFIFRGRDDIESRVDEIALNPITFVRRSDKEVLSTIAHEMVHMWQSKFGDRPRVGYHDKQWARKMEEIGLMPSSTGEPGGKMTGQRVSHYIIDGGLFDIAASDLIANGWRLSWEDVRGASNGLTEMVAITTSGMPIVMAPADGKNGAGVRLEIVDGSTKDLVEPSSDLPWTLDELPSWIRKCAVDPATPAATAGGGNEGSEGEGDEAGSTVQTVYYKNRPVLVRTAPPASTPSQAKKGGVRFKYVCPACRAAVWGKADLKILCQSDNQVFITTTPA